MASSTSSHMSPDPSSTSSNRSSSTTDLKFRRATFQDYDAVVELSKDLFEGVYDYMKTMFFQFLHSKDHHVYVLEYNKQLVALSLVQTHPEKKLLTAMSGRVRPSFAGHGVFKDGGAIVQLVQETYPNSTHLIGCSLLRSGVMHELTTPSSTIFYKWNFYRLKYISLDHLRNRLKMAPASSSSTVRELSYSESVDMLEKDGGQEIQSILRRYASEFVPAGLNWLPVGINKEGLKHIFSTSTVATTYEAVGSVHTEAIQSSTTNAPQVRPFGQPGKLTAISYSYSIPGNGPVVLPLFFYGDDVTDLLEHFRFHLRHLVNICKDDRATITLHFPTAILKRRVAQQIEEFLDDTSGIYTNAMCYRSKL